MDYEKKYKDALEIARKINSGEGVAAPPDWTSYEVIFPELKESEDERVRKAIISILKGETGYTSKEDTDNYVAWLEKQGKRLGADEVTKHQWISVEDELPNNYERVIAAFGRHFARICFHCGDTWYLDNPPVAEPMSGITHWMPLPPPPHHIIDANKKVDRVIGTADHIKTALDVLNKKGGEE